MRHSSTQNSSMQDRTLRSLMNSRRTVRVLDPIARPARPVNRSSDLCCLCGLSVRAFGRFFALAVASRTKADACQASPLLLRKLPTLAGLDDFGDLLESADWEHERLLAVAVLSQLDAQGQQPL